MYCSFAQDQHGSRPLHICIQNNDLPVTEFLLQYGAETKVRDANGKKPAHYAKNKDMLKLIKKYK